MISPRKGLKKIIFICIIIVSLILTNVIVSFNNEVKAPTPPKYDKFGNMIITNGSTVVIENYPSKLPFKQNGHIFVNDSSTLIIRKSTFLMSPHNDIVYNVTVDESSTLRIENSDFTIDTEIIGASYELSFQIKNSTLEIIDSSIMFPGEINLLNSTLRAINSKFIAPKDGADCPPLWIINSSYVYYEDCILDDFPGDCDGVPWPMKLFGNTTLIGINTYISIGWDFNQMMVANSSHVEFYGVSLFSGSYNYNPLVVTHDQGWLNIYRWLKVNVTDKINVPLADARVDAKNVTGQYIPPPKSYVLDYLNKQQSDYNKTNSLGAATLPIFTDNLTKDSMPNSRFVGNYQITAHFDQLQKSMNVGLPSYPSLTTASNNPMVSIIFDDLIISPKNNTYYHNSFSDIIISSGKGTIRNSIFQNPSGGISDMSFGQQGNIIVNGTGSGGQLDLVSSRLGMEQNETNKYFILIEENGLMNFYNASAIMDGIVSPGEYPINVYMSQSAKMSLEKASSLEDLGLLVMEDNSMITIDNSSIRAEQFYAEGTNRNLIINALNNSMINVTTLTLLNADITLENTEISTASDIIFKDVLMNGSNITFDHPIKFSQNSKANLINITNPGFFNITTDGNSHVDLSWWLEITVKDSQGNMLDGAEITVWNYSSVNNKLIHNKYKTGYTDGNGKLTLPLLGGIVNSSGHIFGGVIGNYYINATYHGSESDSTRATSTRSRQTGGGGVNVFGGNQELEIIIPGTPDLVIDTANITFDQTQGVKNADLNIYANITNKGNFTAFNIYTEIWDDTDNKLLYEYKIDILEPGKSFMVNTTYKFTSEGEHDIEVAVDPDQLITELNENNNMANKTIYIENKDKPDLIIVQNSISTDQSTPISNNSPVIVEAKILNVGSLDAYNFMVGFYIYPPGESKFMLGEKTIAALGIDDDAITVKPTQIWRVNKTGEYKIEVVVDIYYNILELNEDNNSLLKDIDVVKGPDLTVGSIGFSQTPPITRENAFSIIANVRNVGPSKSPVFKVRFYKNTLREEDSIGEVTSMSGLDPGEDSNVKLQITKELAMNIFDDPGTYQIFIKVDPDNLISEINEDNNTNWTNLEIKQKADLSITSEEILFNVTQADNGIDFTITATVRNIGETNSNEFIVRFFDGDPADDGGQIPADINYQGIEAGKHKTFKMEWNTTEGGIHEIYVEIATDPLIFEEEIYKNNKAFTAIYVKTLPDLYVTEDDIVSDKDNEEILLGYPIKFFITVHNGGDTTARNFGIELWDGPPNSDESEQIEFSDTVIETLEGISHVVIGNITHYFKTTGLHRIHVVVDPENVIRESDEFNNTAYKTYWINITAIDLTVFDMDKNKVLDLNDITLQVKPKAKNTFEDQTDKTAADGQEIRFKFKIKNVGNIMSENTTVKAFLMIGNASQDYEPQDLGEMAVEALKDGNATNDFITTKSIKVQYDSKIKDYALWIIIDPDDLIKESDKKNNNITIKGVLTIIDVNMKLESFLIENEMGDTVYYYGGEPKPIDKGDILSIKIYIKNEGNSPGNAKIELILNGNPYYTLDAKDVMDHTINTTLFEYTLPEMNNVGVFNLRIEVNGTRDFVYDDDWGEVSLQVIKPDGAGDGKEAFIGSMLFFIIIIIVIAVLCAVVGALFMKKKKQEKMAECSECGELIPIDADVCPKCGAEFSDEIECGECGELMKITDTTCQACGAVFAKDAEAKGEDEEESEKEIDGPQEGEPGDLGDEEVTMEEEGSVEENVTETKDLGKPAFGVATPTPPAPKPGKPAAPAAQSVAPPTVAAGPGPNVAAPGEIEDAEEGEFQEKAECYRCGAIVPLSASMCPECGAEFE